MSFHALESSYYPLAEIAVTNEIITTAISEFMAKVTKSENEHLQRYGVNLMDNLELLQFLYLKKYNFTSIVSVVRFPEQTCAMGEQFNNLPLARQV